MFHSTSIVLYLAM